MKFWYERGAWVSKKKRKEYSKLEPSSIKSIAIIRHAALGDLILVRAFIAEARIFFPNASITLSVVSNYQFGVPDDLVDRVHVAIGSDQRNVPKIKQIKVAKSLGYHDIIFDMSVTSRSILLCLVNKAKLKVSYPYKLWQRIFYDACVFRSDMKFEAETLLDMLRIFGASPSRPINFHIPSNTLSNELVRNKKYIVYFTSASTSSKCWPVEHYAELITQLASKYEDFEHIILEGLASWESVEPLMTIVNNSAVSNVIVQKPISINDTLTFLQDAVLVVSNDTSIRNMAICCDTPTIGIFYSTVPYRYWPSSGKHDAVFNPDGSIPAVNSALSSIDNILNSIDATDIQ